MFENHSDNNYTKRKQPTFHAANDGNKFARLKIYLLIILDIIF